MRFRYYDTVTDPGQLADIMELLTLCDGEFVPPLSARDSTVQSTLDLKTQSPSVPTAYFESIRGQSTFVALSGGKVVGFMSLRKNHVCQEIQPSDSPNIYITTIIVHPHHRRQGITNEFYRRLLAKFKNLPIYTRTWSGNDGHINILSSLKFHEYCRIEDDRGPGIDTIYYCHNPTKVGFWQTIKQYRLTGNLLFLVMLLLFAVASVLTWVFSDGGAWRELSIAFATSLIASALCLMSDTALKYRDSKNDEYINNLKSFGIENLQFHKDALLETLIPKCRNEIWITGYRLIMTGKKPFRQALCQACRRTHGLRVLVLTVPPWSETFRRVYGDEDVSENYLNIFSDLCACVAQYGTQLQIRFTDKPIFNDTYKVDDRFITSPYLHCLDERAGRITAKDFFSLDINDPHKRLYDLIYRDYMSVWEESSSELDIQAFQSALERTDIHRLDKEARWKLLNGCCIARQKIPQETTP